MRKRGALPKDKMGMSMHGIEYACSVKSKQTLENQKAAQNGEGNTLRRRKLCMIRGGVRRSCYRIAKGC